VARDSASLEFVRGLQERAARAQPAEHLERIGDWWLRHTGGSSWWVGTVLAHGEADPEELDRRIRAAEDFYARFGATTAMQLAPGVCAAALDGMLAARGYVRSSDLTLMTARADAIDLASSALPVRLDEAPNQAWLEARSAVVGERQAEAAMHARVRARSVFASVTQGDRIVAVGRAVLDDGWAGVFSMRTLPAARRRGAGRSVLGALAGWAVERDAEGLYLQVEGGNEPAVRLYESAGFTATARYHYRSQPARRS